MRRLLVATGGAGGFRSPYNDEFDGTGPMAWTMAGTNPPDVNSTTPGKLYMPSGSTAHRALLPPMPFTLEAYCSSLLFDNINTPAGAGPNIAQASPGGPPGPVWWGPDWDIDIPGTICQFDGRWSNFSTQTGHLGTKTNETAGLTLQVPFWYRVIVHSATNMDVQWSTNGSSWTTYGTGFNPTLTPGAVMMMSFACTTEWDYVRFT